MDNRSDIENQLNTLEKSRKKLLAESKKVVPWHILVPIMVFVISFLVSKVLPISLFITAVSAVLSGIVYSATILNSFKNLTAKLKFSLLDKFIKDYHPDINFKYFQHARNGYSIIKASELISADRYDEEDVIHGESKGVKFYISEVHLKNKNDDSTVTVFRGILFKINLPDRNFPKTIIQSKPGLLKQIFGNFKKNEEYGFWYDSDSEAQFEKSLGPLFPFLKHLIERQGDIRLKAEGNEVVLMLETGMRFLDEPKPRLSKTFLEKEFANRLGQQLNSLLFIVESFANNLEKSEIQERLELKAIDYLKINKT